MKITTGVLSGGSENLRMCAKSLTVTESRENCMGNTIRPNDEDVNDCMQKIQPVSFQKDKEIYPCACPR